MAHRTCNEPTIIAQATPTGPGAIALVRLSGAQAIAITQQLGTLSSGLLLADVPTHTIHHGTIFDIERKAIDQVLFLVMHAPRTFTGEDTVEITCHNNPFIIEAIIEHATHIGARIAYGGEFTQRAVLNNKIDLLQAEAIQEVINANSQLALKTSMAQLQGSFSHTIATIEQDLIKALALSEASFEFLDEEYLEFSAQIATSITQVQQTIQQLKQHFNQQQQLRLGFKIALIGSVNAGKSSLFNALIGTARAIVSSIAGTTRDSIEASKSMYGTYVTFIDTAGLRTTNDIIEQEGISRSLQQASLADIVILTIDQSCDLSKQERVTYQSLLEQYPEKTILVYTKSDLEPIPQPFTPQGTICVSSKTGAGIDLLHQAMGKKIEGFFASTAAPFLLNKRQYNLLLELEVCLNTLTPYLQMSSVPFELVSKRIQQSLEHLSQLTGKTVSESAMDAIFRQFCVGK